MAFAAGRDDESEALGRAVEEHIAVVSTYIILMMQGVQTAQLMDMGEALALETLEAAIITVPTISEVSDQLRTALQRPRPRQLRQANFLAQPEAPTPKTPRRTFQLQ